MISCYFWMYDAECCCWVHTCTHARQPACLLACVHACMHARTHVSLRACVHICVFACMLACAHARRRNILTDMFEATCKVHCECSADSQLTSWMITSHLWCDAALFSRIPSQRWLETLHNITSPNPVLVDACVLAVVDIWAMLKLWVSGRWCCAKFPINVD